MLPGGGGEIGPLVRRHRRHDGKILRRLLRQNVHGVVHGDDAHHPPLAVQYRQGQQVVFRQEAGGLLPVCQGAHGDGVRGHQVCHGGGFLRRQQVHGGHAAQQLPPLQHIAGVDGLPVDAGAADGIQRLSDRIPRVEGDELRRHDAAGAVRRVAEQGVHGHPPLRAGGPEDAVHQVGGQLLQKVRRVIRLQAVKELLELPLREGGGQPGLGGTGEIGEHICRGLFRQGAEQRRLPAGVLHRVQEGGDIHGAAAPPEVPEGSSVPGLQKLKDLSFVEHGHGLYLAFVESSGMFHWQRPWSAPPFHKKVPAGDPAGTAAHRGVFVQASASRGVATALSGALLSTRPVDQLVVSPQLCGSSLWKNSGSPW